MINGFGDLRMSLSLSQYGLFTVIPITLLSMVPLATAEEFLPPSARIIAAQHTYQCDALDSCVLCQQGYCLQHAVPPHVSAGAFGSLAWQKGRWQITPYGFLAAEMIASSAPLTSRPFILYVENDIGTDEKQFSVHGQTTALGVDIKGPSVGTFQAGG
ncbi:MAG: hypothetical protein GY809_16025, partial [Planctomycetes bacterium]|nr:hypothetical protein [Planctomycetota bacterium]